MEPGVGPMLGGGSTSPGGGGNPLLGGSCSEASCELAGEGPVVAPPGCGDGVLTADEACDDGNKVSGDGCAEHCLATEPGFSCAAPGQACRQIARCGDGLVAPTEQCDDGNVDSADGCSNRCRVELGKKCDGQPSVCTDAVCGNNIKEGAEACDDGNTTPFDGCSPICLKEPNCSGQSCTSDCGDGLLINEECDDGNLIDGDGCSSTCTLEGGFTCVAQAACETVADQCVLRAPAVFRDFPDSHTDFGGNVCTTLEIGAVAATLDANGRPTLGNNSAAACLSTAASFADWYTSNSSNVTLVGEIVLFDNGQGGYVNRFGADGTPWTYVDRNTERNGGASLAACAATCLNEAQNGQAPFVGGALRCNDLCRPLEDQIQQRTNGQLQQLNNQLNQALNANPPDPVTIADLQAQVADEEATIAQLTLDAAACQTDCQTRLDERVATCTPTCKPCSYDPNQFCIGGVEEVQDGNPLFFPVDSITGPTSDLFEAKVPDQYGYNGFPFERVVFPGRPAASYNHNFYFTSEVQYWFKYDANTQATLTFLGDDDVWVFLNGRLAVDLGGIHVPSTGSVAINGAAGTVTSTMQDGRGAPVPLLPPINRQATTADFGLEEGNVYKITIFQAERQRDGSSFQLTLAGFEATPSECTAICGDNVLSFGEECDDGVNDGGYGECDPGCVLGPFCGDGIRQPEFGEDCDVGPAGDSSCRGCRVLEIQ
jgi:fibro-slime domain-containing protein